MEANIKSTLSFSEDCADSNARLNPTYIKAALASVDKSVT